RRPLAPDPPRRRRAARGAARVSGAIDPWIFGTPYLGEAIEALARAAGLPVAEADLPRPPDDLVQPGGLALGRWIEGAAGVLDLEAEPVESSYADIDKMLRGAGPAIVRFYGSGEPRFVALLGADRSFATLVGPDRRLGRVPFEPLRAAVCEVVEAPLAA